MADDGSHDDFDSAVRSYLKDSDTKADYQKKIEDIRNWIGEQKKRGKENDIKAIDEALKTTVIALEKFKTGDPYDITSGTLDIIASVAAVAGDPYGVAVAAFCAIAGAIVSANKPRSPSVIEQLAQVVQSELINFNRKLQDQNLSGLQGRVRRQLKQLQEMAPKEELDDADLWNDFDQFMGELRPRISSPLPFKYDKNLTTDPEMADFVKALETYCRAYTCFMALLTVAKVKFEELSGRREIETINRFIHHQRETAKEKMLFLSEEKHLTFLGRLPSEGGSLTKILLLSRNPTAKKMIESTRQELGLPVMPESEEVEEKAEKVSRQCVKLKWPAGYGIPQLSNLALFCNETDFPIRVVSGTVGKPKCNLKFEEDVKPHSCHSQNIVSFSIFSIGGYMKIAYNGRLSPKESENPNEGDVGIIEFAMSQNLFIFAFLGGSQYKINIQDKSNTTRTQGQDTYDKMTSGEDNVIYWKKGGKYYLAKCEICLNPGLLMAVKTDSIPVVMRTWRFIIQVFDPYNDVEET